MMLRPSTKRSWFILLSLAIVGVASGFALRFFHPAGAEPRRDEKVTLTVFAAMSTIDVMEEIAAAYERAHPARLRLNFAPSGMLAQQMSAGARPDLFLSADEKWMDDVQQRGLIVPASRRDLLGNRLVLIAPTGKAPRVSMDPTFDLAGALNGRLAIGDPESVAAGRYAKEALAALRWENNLRLLPCLDVRAVLAAVERGEVAAGIVFASDAIKTEKVKVIGEFPENTHHPIRYPAALGKHAAAEATALLDYLSGPAAQRIFIRYGFTVPN